MKHLKEGLIKQRGVVKVIPKSMLKEFDIVLTRANDFYMYLSWNTAKKYGILMSSIYKGTPVFANLNMRKNNIHSSYLVISDYNDDLILSRYHHYEKYDVNSIFRLKPTELIDFTLQPGMDRQQSFMLINPNNLKRLADEKCELIWERK